MYKDFCYIMPCRIVNTDFSEPIRGERLFITFYLNFLQFVIDYSESKDRNAPSYISIMKCGRLERQLRITHRNYVQNRVFVNNVVAEHLVRLNGVTYARDICRASREILTGISPHYFQFYTTDCAGRWRATSEQINALGRPAKVNYTSGNKPES